AFDLTLNLPTVEMINLVEHRSALRAVRQQTLVFGNEVENLLRTGADIVEDGGVFIQGEGLRHVARHEITPPNEFARIRLEYSRGDLQESGFPGTVAPDQSDPLSFVYRE